MLSGELHFDLDFFSFLPQTFTRDEFYFEASMKQLILTLNGSFIISLSELTLLFFSFHGTVIILIVQDVIFREISRPKGDLEVVAAQSREQYFKVTIFMHV